MAIVKSPSASYQKALTVIHYAFLIIQFVSKDMPHADASLIPSRYVVIIDHRILSHQQDEASKVNQNFGHMSIHNWRVLSGKRETGQFFYIQGPFPWLMVDIRLQIVQMHHR